MGTIVIIVLAAIGVWIFGSVVARWGGIVVCGFGLFGMQTSVSFGWLVFALGFIFWLTGHWLYAFKFHGWKSSLAQRIFNTGAFRRLDPTRNWGIRTITLD